MPITLNGTTGITTPSIDASAGNSALTTLSVGGNNISAVNGNWRNRIINGAMMIDQRNAGASVTPSTLYNQYTLDRWNYLLTQASKASIQQNAGSVTPPAGFRNYLGVTSTSAYSVGSGDFFALQQVIEGFNIADLGWGAAGAQTVTLSFWVRSSLTGTFGGALSNSNDSRAYAFTFSISAANTWEYKTVTIAGDTSGTWQTNNTAGIKLHFGLGVGSTYAGAAGSWASANYISATGTTSVVGTNGATFYITGVQLEAGSVATPFERRDYGRELMMCYRYYFRNAAVTTYSMLGVFGTAASTTNIFGYVNLPVTMRTTPSVATANSRLADSQTGIAISSLSVSQSSPISPEITFVVSGAVQYRPYYLQANNSTSGYIEYSAEL